MGVLGSQLRGLECGRPRPAPFLRWGPPALVDLLFLVWSRCPVAQPDRLLSVALRLGAL